MMVWSHRSALLGGVSLILAVNAIVLGGVVYNRSGEPETRLSLSERELRSPYGRFNRSENSGVELALQWRVPVDPGQHEPAYGYGYESWGGVPVWLDRAKLVSLGFGTLPEKRGSGDGYRLPQSKEVLLVLELDGAAARQTLGYARQKLADEERLRVANPGNNEFERRTKTAREALQREERENSRLFAVDAGLDLAALRAQYADRSRFLIARGFVRPQFVARNKQESVYGHISALSVSRINVPVEYQPALQQDGVSNDKMRFNATVNWGRRLEPWLADLRRFQAGKGGPNVGAMSGASNRSD